MRYQRSFAGLPLGYQNAFQTETVPPLPGFCGAGPFGRYPEHSSHSPDRAVPAYPSRSVSVFITGPYLSPVSSYGSPGPCRGPREQRWSGSRPRSHCPAPGAGYPHYHFQQQGVPLNIIFLHGLKQLKLTQIYLEIYQCNLLR